MQMHSQSIKSEKRGSTRVKMKRLLENTLRICPKMSPPKATLTEKEINGNRYYYWQWREGDKIKSQYKGPVNPSE